MSESQGDNMKARELYCPKCRTYSFSDRSNAKCLTCETLLLTVVRNSISGQRITGQ